MQQMQQAHILCAFRPIQPQYLANDINQIKRLLLLAIG